MYEAAEHLKKKEEAGWTETARQDLRYGLRLLRRNPGFTLMAVTALALGIGANTAVFSVIHAVLLRPLPYREAGQLVKLRETNPQKGWEQREVAPGKFFDWRERSRAFTDLAASLTYNVNLTGDEAPERVQLALVTANLLPLLGVEPVRGRSFLEEEQEEGSDRVVLLSHGLWQRRYGSSPGAIGMTVVLDGEPHQVVGVLPTDFDYPADTDVWKPAAWSGWRSRVAHSLSVVGRLRSDVTLRQARAEMQSIAHALEQEYAYTDTGWRVGVNSLHDDLVGDVRPALLVLLAAVAFVLLIACANVANLLLARAVTREKEMAVRAALGANRTRLIRQLLAESLLLGALGGAAGLLLARWGIEALLALSPPELPRMEGTALSPAVLVFTAAVAVLTGILFGLAPAVHASKPDINETLKEGGRRSVGARRGGRLRSFLVVAEVALAVVLLIGAGLLIRSFESLRQVDPGFNPENLLTLRFSLPADKYGRGDARAAQLCRELLQRVEAVPGMESAAAVNYLPFSGATDTFRFQVEGRGVERFVDIPTAEIRAASPGYFRTMGIPLLAGRRFTNQDDPTAPGVAIVNQSWARRFWPGENPLGKRISVRGEEGPWHSIVGLVGDVRHEGLDRQAEPELYLPYFQEPWPGFALVVRTTADPLALVAAVKSQIRAVDKDLPAYDIRTMQQRFAGSLAERRFSTVLLGVFAVMAVVLASVGVYGVISYAVSQRTHEIGVRMALGARPRDIFRLVLGQGMTLALLGLGVGLAGAFALTHFLSGLLFEVSATDPITFAGIGLLLALVALLACTIPARRAMRLNPMVALRCE